MARWPAWKRGNTVLKVLCVGGIGESSPDDNRDAVSGMLRNVTDRLDPEQFESHWVPWPAEYGPDPKLDGIDYLSAISLGESLVRKKMNDLGDSSYILLGYSGGAHVAGNVATGNDAIVGCAVIADPMRQRLRWPAGYGVLGERTVKGCWFWSVANPNDIICSCPANSPLRSIADITRGFSVTDPAQWGNTLLSTVWQKWWEDPYVDWGGVAIGLAGYLSPYPWSQHTGYDHMIMPGTTVMYTEWLAGELNSWKRWNEKPSIQ